MAKKIITVNYEMPFKGMMVQAGIPRHQVAKIVSQLGSESLPFKYKTPHQFGVADSCFDEPMRSGDAARRIRESATTDFDWKPFDIEHLLEDFKENRKKYELGSVFACSKNYDVGGVPHIFSLGIDKGYPDLELVPADHAWAAHVSNFRKRYKVS